jgi:hypothetical protein
MTLPTSEEKSRQSAAREAGKRQAQTLAVRLLRWTAATVLVIVTVLVGSGKLPVQEAVRLLGTLVVVAAYWGWLFVYFFKLRARVALRIGGVLGVEIREKLGTGPDGAALHWEVVGKASRMSRSMVAAADFALLTAAILGPMVIAGLLAFAISSVLG